MSDSDIDESYIDLVDSDFHRAFVARSQRAHMKDEQMWRLTRGN